MATETVQDPVSTDALAAVPAAQTAPSAPALSTEGLLALVAYAGPVRSFWPLYLQALVQATGARRALMLSAAVGRPWQARAHWPLSGAESPDDAQRSLRLLAQAQALPLCLDIDGPERALALQPSGLLADEGQKLVVVLLQLPGHWDAAQWQAWGHVAAAVPARYTARQAALADQAAQADQVAQVGLSAKVPHPGAMHPATQGSLAEPPADGAALLQASTRAQRLYGILELTRSLSQEDRFTQAAMTLCNQLCSRLGAERVSLGWCQGTALRLVAISHVEHFDAQSNATRALEEVMEEALDQEAVLTYPAEAGHTTVLRAHQAYAQSAAPAAGPWHLGTVPLEWQGQVQGVLCVERQAPAFSASDVWELTQTGQASVPWLAHLHAQDRWWGLRAWHAVQAAARAGVGPRHTALKAGGVLLAIFVLLASLTPWAYRVDASLLVRSRDVLFIPAPFDGYLREVQVDVGDSVAQGQTLLALDTRDVLLEASMAEADLERYAREAEKAMAARQLAEMQIALARQQQASAKLELIRFQLDNATVKAPFAGVVIEGDLKKNLGAPVRKGDLLVKLAQNTRIVLELEIDQSVVHEVQVGTRGEFALVGRPGERLPIQISHLDPAAVSKEGKTVYLARALLLSAEPADWRPGMGGNAKLDAGERALIWVMTHRSVRFLREFFWL